MTPSVADSRQDGDRENRGERRKSFMTGWLRYQRVTGGTCLFFSECTLWPLPTGHSLSSLKIEPLAWWDAYHLTKWTEKSTERSFGWHCTQNKACTHDNTHVFVTSRVDWAWKTSQIQQAKNILGNTLCEYFCLMEKKICIMVKDIKM